MRDGGIKVMNSSKLTTKNYCNDDDRKKRTRKKVKREEIRGRDKDEWEREMINEG